MRFSRFFATLLSHTLLILYIVKNNNIDTLYTEVCVSEKQNRTGPMMIFAPNANQCCTGLKIQVNSEIKFITQRYNEVKYADDIGMRARSIKLDKMLYTDQDRVMFFKLFNFFISTSDAEKKPLWNTYVCNIYFG
ncbi:hypothetical protein PHYBLDRAFT_62699 [Phycomyces blakesleeanus NRRL 1555(-)]|uniref:Reverse transcriptase domain-containing protein n=1 Tax=Phycomyces blakesleeanus (strain ATCC 8743b / DSM 1359 / FGSC 10004 / NBRC 33097 / NRRL 1555) TaxID=763407 RepID=A0A167PU03_PHYB8|nr:hypothetical protein PHYBLDRAFT_62699 [Phycomyces blakesleeanus NRRL 1555(-)]OAD78536.1 hypothetical protein PHYBLDRAFT_62699 [Phycomyces blakesleeanus NRRL 1555(-)]|eukprot:XP_018296576.1 hypothetical protein PHYBLDRAFT_62699 [Phycomyces blakesleeanus NRRL 1555(-)]